MMSGIILLHKNSSDQKSLQYLDTGLDFFTSRSSCLSFYQQYANELISQKRHLQRS